MAAVATERTRRHPRRRQRPRAARARAAGEDRGRRRLDRRRRGAARGRRRAERRRAARRTSHSTSSAQERARLRAENAAARLAAVESPARPRAIQHLAPGARSAAEAAETTYLELPREGTPRATVASACSSWSLDSSSASLAGRLAPDRRRAQLGQLAASQHHETKTVPAPGGTISDRLGVQLAIGEEATTVYADPRRSRARAGRPGGGEHARRGRERALSAVARQDAGLPVLPRKADPEQRGPPGRRLAGLGF